ncbi:MAG TPA: hypothetical protein VK661_03005, partial [Planctomycetota bacterium]|nr:hypothetical protein [Planctomycetota bacterium]
TRSDAAEVILLSYRALPDPPLDARWTAVRSSARAAIRPDEGADRRRLYKLLLELRTDPDIPQLFQEMVAKCRGTEDIPFLLAVLEDPDRMISMYAAGNLRGTNPGPYADEIVKRLERAKPSHQATLLRCLQNSTDRRFLKLFLEKLEAPEPEARSAAFDAVAAWDPEALTEIVLGKLKSKNDDQIVPGLWMALKLKKPGQDPRPEFVKEAGRIFLENPDPKVSARAFGLLMWCVKSECFTLEVILHGLAHGNAGVRRQSAARGGELKGAEIIAALKRALDDPDDETAAFASISLFALKETVPVDRVRALLKSKERNAKSQAMRSLTYILGKEARPDLAALLDDPDISTQMMAIYHFGTLGVDGYEAKLRKKLEGEYNVSMAAARVLAPTGDAACWPVIKKYLGSDMHQLAPSAALLAYPGKAKALQAVVLKLSSEGTTAAVFLENLQDSLRSVGIALETHLAPEALSARVQRPPLQEKTVLSLAWLPSLLQGAFWFFDGEALHVLPEGEARKRWIEWAKSR